MSRQPKTLIAGWLLTGLIAIPVLLAGIWLFIETFLVSLPVGLVLFAGLLAIAGVGTLPVVLLAAVAIVSAIGLGARRLAKIDGERRRAEQARADTETHLRQILETSSDAFVVIDSGGVITDWTREAQALLGWPKAWAVGRPLAELIGAESQGAEFLGGLGAALTGGDGSVIGRAREIGALHRDGYELPIELTISPTAGGQVFRVFLRVADDHWAEEEAKRTRTLLADLLDSAPDAVVIADESGQITLVNEQTERLFGYDRTELIGAPIETLLPRRFRKRHASHRGGYLQAPGTRPMGVGLELAGRRKDSTEFPVDISLSAITTDKGRLVTAFVRDITERKRTQDELASAHGKALEASRLKSEFVANMSHEIRTPLNGLMGMSGLLLGTDLSEEQREYAEAVRTSGDALMTVIDDILDFSKIEAGKLELAEEAFSLRDQVDDACAMLAPAANAKGLELVAWVDESVPDAIWGDGPRLRQVLVNLLSNAVKFTAEGEVVTTVSGGPDGSGRLTLRFEVSDTGIGIDSGSLDGIFESFSQGDSSTTRSYGGTGLGLSISKRLVGLMRGEIGATSEPGSGSVFWFTTSMGMARLVRPAPDPVAFDGTRALLVDDNETSRTFLQRRLASWGIECTAVADATSALDALGDAAGEGRPYELALLDSDMPGIDGAELVAAIRFNPALDPVHLLMLTSSGNGRSRARHLGVEGFVAKPVRESRLRDEIARVLGGESAEPQPEAPVGAPNPLVGLEAGERVVLVAEDNPVNQLVASRLLERRGLTVDLAANGREAVEKHRKGGYGVIFMDCQMPELDGYQATAAIREYEGDGRHTPIIAMTANTMKGDRERCLEAGMDGYLGKPLDLASLDQILATALLADDLGLASAVAPTPTSDSGAPPILDPETLADVCGEDDVLRGELVSMFTERGATALDELAGDVEAGDLAAVRRTAHTLKGSAAVIGAKKLADIAGRLCAAAESGAVDDVATLQVDLADAYELTADALGQTLTAGHPS